MTHRICEKELGYFLQVHSNKERRKQGKWPGVMLRNSVLFQGIHKGPNYLQITCNNYGYVAQVPENNFKITLYP